MKKLSAKQSNNSTLSAALSKIRGTRDNVGNPKDNRLTMAEAAVVLTAIWDLRSDVARLDGALKAREKKDKDASDLVARIRDTRKQLYSDVSRLARVIAPRKKPVVVSLPTEASTS